jgi:hypothetical protein
VRHALGFLQARFARAQRLGGFTAQLRHLQVRPDARLQLARAERLDQIVVGAGVHAFDAALLARARGEHDHRRVARARVGAQRAQEPESVEPRHHHVGEHEIRTAIAHRLERRLSVCDRDDAVAFREQAHDVLTHVRVVVGHQDARSAVRGISARSERRNRHALVVRRQFGRERIVLPQFVGQPAQRFLDVRPAPAARRGVAAALADLLARQMVRAQRHRDRERRAFVDDAVRCDRSAVQLDQLQHQREPDAAAFVRAPARVLDAVKAFEQARDVLGRDARARVAHAQLDARSALTQRDRDLAFERELERVRQQVQADLLPHVAVDEHG